MLVVYHLQEHLKLIVEKLKSCKDIDVFLKWEVHVLVNW